MVSRIEYERIVEEWINSYNDKSNLKDLLENVIGREYDAILVAVELIPNLIIKQDELPEHLDINVIMENVNKNNIYEGLSQLLKERNGETDIGFLYRISLNELAFNSLECLIDSNMLTSEHVMKSVSEYHLTLGRMVELIRILELRFGQGIYI